MLESGVPVVYAYISDIHGNEYIPGLAAAVLPARRTRSAAARLLPRPGAYYNQAFGTFFQRLAADGITPQNTLFVLSSDEGDHEAGANVGRAIQPTPANCDGVTVAVHLPGGHVRRARGQRHRPARHAEDDTTPFGMENDTAPEFYVNGEPGPTRPEVRTFEHDVAALTADNPYAGGTQNDRQLPRRPDRRGDPAHGQRRPGADPDARRCSPSPTTTCREPAAAECHAAPCVTAEHRVRLGPR